MSVQRFSIGKRFRWRGVLFEVKRLLPKGEVNIEDVTTTGLRVVPLSELVAAFFDDDLFFVVDTRPKKADPATGDQGTAAVAVRSLSDYPSHLVAVARRRLEIIQPLLTLGDSCTKADVRNHVAAIKVERGTAEDKEDLASAISVRSIYRWLGDYRKSGGDIRSLVPVTRNCGGPGTSRLDPEVGILVDSTIRDNYYRREVVTVKDLYYLVAAAVEEENRLRPKGEWLACPCQSTVARRVDALDMYDRFAAKHGQRAARRAFTQYGQMDYPTHPLERVEIDATPVDLIVVDEHDLLPLGRPNLTKALDTSTRYPLGWYLGFEPPSYYSVMECLYHGICPKADTVELYGTEHQLAACGIPYLLMVDNGKEFIGVDLEEACLSLGIVLQYSPVRTPEFKAAIERHLRTCTGLFHTLPGTSFANIVQRGDYDSVRRACMTLADLDKTFNIFMADVYAERFHKGLGGIPARRWEAATVDGFSPRLPESADELRILLGRVAWRTVQHYGIDFLNLRYNCHALARLRGRLGNDQAKLKYHPGDLGAIHVYDPFHDDYIAVPCLDAEYAAGLSLWKHRVICAYIRNYEDREDPAALGRAKKRIQEVVDAALSRKRRQSGKKLARWETGGQPAGGGSSKGGRDPGPASPPPPAKVEADDRGGPTSLPDDDASLLALGPPDEEKWGLSYNLPRNRDSTMPMEVVDGNQHST